MKLLSIAIAVAVIMTAPLTVRADIYPSCGIVTEIENDVVIYTEFNGNRFGFYGVEDWVLGDIVATVMDDNGTPKVNDDVILFARYCGHIERW